MIGIGTFLPELWHALGGIMQLRGDAYVEAKALDASVFLAVATVLMAGLSEAFGQSIVLFASRVKPARFILSLFVDALLFAFGYVFLVLSTWVVTRLPSTSHISLRDLALVIALSYAPLLFSFLTAMPYLGAGLLRALHVWHFLALLVGIAAIARVDMFTAATYVWLGWLVTVLARHTFGKPIVNLGAWLLDAVAGVKIVSDPYLAIGQTERAQARSLPPPAATESQSHEAPKRWLVVAGLCGMALLAILVALALEPVRQTLFGWQHHLPPVLRVPLDLLWFGIIAIVVAGVMAPFETLGWWAGWYGDAIDTAGETATGDSGGAADVARYVLYLDGIQQSNDAYTPDVEVFLDALVPNLPRNVELVRGVLAYSVLNQPLDADPLFSRFWKFVESRRDKNIKSLIGMFINLRNVLIVAVSADSRYGPMYNFGIAEVMYRSLIAEGYRARSGIPVTLIGYSGGGQMACGAATFLKRALDAPVDVISLGGVISGSDPILDLEHLYHFVGDKDNVERVGPIMFASRWPIAKLSYWNRAKRLGMLTQISLGPVGHQVPGGMFDPNEHLPDGRTFLQQTIDRIVSVLGDRLTAEVPVPRKPSNYQRYAEGTGKLWVSLADATIAAPAGSPYLPVAEWIGRLVLPKREERFGGVWFDVRNAPVEHAGVIGSRMRLRWSRQPDVRERVRAVTHDVNFSAEVQAASEFGGSIMPVRLNRWRLVDPLESLAGAHPIDDVVVKLIGAVTVHSELMGATLRIEREPVQITGRYYGLVRFQGPAPGTDDGFVVRHFDRVARAFSGPEEIVRMPAITPDLDGHPNSTTTGIDRSPLNDEGWYVYGGFADEGAFVVQSLAPRRLLRPDGAVRPLADSRDAERFVRREIWPQLIADRGDVVAAANASWKTGDVGLLVHSYGGIGGPNRERGAKGPIYFGHFAYGIAEVVEDPLASEPRFEITYYQIYTQNTDGVIAGALDWSRYLGDRQYGWAGIRPVCDAILQHDAFTGPFDLTTGGRASALETLRPQLEAMAARYRIGDGTGGTFVGAANNCSQDSNRALFATLQNLARVVESDPQFEARMAQSEADLARYRSLKDLARALRRRLLLFGAPRSDWSLNEYNLGTTMEDAPLANLIAALGSWRCILPRLAFNTIVGTFLQHGASVTVLGTCYLGGERSDVKPVVPTAL